MDTCIYCNKNKANSNEHILQENLGGKLSSNKILCSECNALFGSTIDKRMAEDLSILRCIYGIKTKRKRTINFEGKNLTGEPVKINAQTGEVVNLNEHPKVISNTRKINVTGNFQKSKNIIKKQSKSSHVKLNSYEVIAQKNFIELDNALSNIAIAACFKTVINYWKYISDNEDISYILPVSHTLYQCVKDNSNKRLAPLQKYMAQEYIKIEFSAKAKENYFNDISIDHHIILIKKDNILYGIIVLFNKICLMFTLAKNYTGVIDFKHHCFSINSGKTTQPYQLSTANFSIKTISTETGKKLQQEELHKNTRHIEHTQIEKIFKSCFDYSDFCDTLVDDIQVIDEIFKAKIYVIFDWITYNIQSSYQEEQVNKLKEDFFQLYKKHRVRHEANILSEDSFVEQMNVITNLIIQVFIMANLVPMDDPLYSKCFVLKNTPQLLLALTTQHKQTYESWKKQSILERNRV